MARYTLKRKRTSGGAVPSFTAKIIDQASTQILQITLPPNTSILTNQNTMSFMSGHLKTTASIGGFQEPQEGSGMLNALKRAVSGQSFLINKVVNPSSETAELTLSPNMPSAITELTLKPGEEWKISPGSILAATPNVAISGSLNILDNFKASFVTGTAVYSTAVVKEGTNSGSVWITGYGGIDKRNITPSETPFILNNGIFLAMPTKHWKSYVDVGTAHGFLDSLMTNLGIVMKIQKKTSDTTPAPTFPLYMQTINIANMQKMIKTIAAEQVNRRIQN
jgi:uncharacterized protein (AIM24 family)